MKKDYDIYFSKQALKDIKKLKQANVYSYFMELISIIRNDPFSYPPSYKRLKGKYKFFYSRRLNDTHRLVYSVDSFSGKIYVVSAWSHYEGLH